VNLKVHKDILIAHPHNKALTGTLTIIKMEIPTLILEETLATILGAGGGTSMEAIITRVTTTIIKMMMVMMDIFNTRLHPSV
jgi:hypothetical protein